MEPIKVVSKDFYNSVKAFELLFKRTPKVKTCHRFDDIDGNAVFGSCEIVSYTKNIVKFEADGEIYSAKIKDIEYFVFY